ncbi:MAG: hypothetical protein WCF85_20190 [Rhodospirillaceae bacterium]
MLAQLKAGRAEIPGAVVIVIVIVIVSVGFDLIGIRPVTTVFTPFLRWFRAIGRLEFLTIKAPKRE